MDGKCGVLHPELRLKCVRKRNHRERQHMDMFGDRWVNTKITTTTEMLVNIFRTVGDRITY